MIESNNLIGQILHLRPEDVVVVTLGDWSERRSMMTKDEQVKFKQAKEEDGDWMITDFISPETDDWYDVQRNAYHMGLQVPFIVWSGPVNEFPEKLLQCDSPLMVRLVDHPGWMNLRKEAKKALSSGVAN